MKRCPNPLWTIWANSTVSEMWLLCESVGRLPRLHVSRTASASSVTASITDQRGVSRHKSGFSPTDTIIIDLYTRRFTSCQSRHSTGVERRHQFQLQTAVRAVELWTPSSLAMHGKDTDVCRKDVLCHDSRRPNEIDNCLKDVVWSQSLKTKPKIEVENCKFRCAHVHNCHF